jgi:Tfp pilus assembly protein PilO
VKIVWILLMLLMFASLAWAVGGAETPDLRLIVAQQETRMCREYQDQMVNALARARLQMDLMAERIKLLETKPLAAPAPVTP